MNNLKSLKASNSRALLSLLLPFAIGVGGVLCVLQESIAVQVLGHVLLSIFFLQTFILLHECGHLNFFSSRWANVWVGRLMGLLTLIPFYTWKEMHNLHHRWTGWRDLDPTTSGTVGPGASKTKNAIVNICWKLFVPVFYLGYKIGNYWWLPKMSKFLPESKYKKARVSVIAYAISYVLLGWFFWSRDSSPFCARIFPQFAVEGVGNHDSAFPCGDARLSRRRGQAHFLSRSNSLYAKLLFQ